mmetsp:Transcript_81143/g.218066  ORF Transcript_81143/g.218066 Transcript_81143/m.218066 type:complete len:209 (-) Transcript_81143:770-1396(-)
MGFLNNAFGKSRNAPPAAPPASDTKSGSSATPPGAGLTTVNSSRVGGAVEAATADGKFSIEDEEEDEGGVHLVHESLASTPAASHFPGDGKSADVVDPQQDLSANHSNAVGSTEHPPNSCEPEPANPSRREAVGEGYRLAGVEPDGEVDVSDWTERLGGQLFPCKRVSQRGECSPRYLLVSHSVSVIMDLEAHKTRYDPIARSRRVVC